MKELFRDKNFNKSSMDIIIKANKIIDEYETKGFELTLRQLYYQFVAKGFLDNHDRNYKRLGSIINDARLAGLVDWDNIKDRTRFLRKPTVWENPGQIIKAATNQYSIDKWQGQNNYLEVWVEKDALIDIVEQSSKEYQVSCFSCRGYVSQSAMYEAGKRLYNNTDDKEIHIIHLGDHDPSGIDMTRDIFERLELFSNWNINIHRIALNMDQVKQYNPPPNPAKVTDSRAKEYINNYGSKSWELDALNPEDLRSLIQGKILSLMDYDLYYNLVEEEERQKHELTKIANEIMDKGI
jgi:hypothetical protein